MRSWLQAATLLLASGSAFALPHSRHAGKDIATVAGSTGPDFVSVQFSSPCKGCIPGSEAEVELNLQVNTSDHECDISKVTLNGLALVPTGWGRYDRGNIVLTSKSAGQASDVEVSASWRLTCLNKKTSLLSVNFNNVLEQDESAKPSGFAVSFRQNERPVVLRLRNQPIRDATASGVREEWIDVSPELQLIVVPPSLEGEMHDLEEIKVQIGELYHQYLQQERKITKMIKHDFESCNGMKCMFQTAMRKAPDALALIKAHFRHPCKQAHRARMQAQETWMNPTHEDVEEQADSAMRYGADDLEPQHDELRPPPPPPGHGPPHHEPEYHGPPFDEEHPPPPPPEDHREPPFDDERPHPPPEHHGPPFEGKRPPPPPPHHGPPHHEPEHHGPARNETRDHSPPHHGGPPPEDFPHHGPPSEHHPPPWDHPGRHHRPHFRHHGPHHRPLLLTIISVLLLIIFVSSITLVIRGKKDKFRKQRKRQNRLARCEERRNRVAYRCAAAQHRWSRWWSQFRQPESTADYDEKRARIINQEGALEDVMQNEIRDLRRAHELVGELMRAEEGRQRLYHEANFGTSRHASIYEAGEGSSNSMETSLPAYQLPPPSYEAELEGEMTVVDGFRYTPSNTGSTPDSSVVDCISRISFETGSLGAGGLKDF